MYKQLINIVGIPGIIDGVSSPSTAYHESNNELMQLAKLNKIQLLYALRMKTNDREQMLDRYNGVIETLHEVCNELNAQEINYAVFKTIKPFPSTPSDIDLLVADEHIHLSIELLKSRGYVSTAKDMFCVTMSKQINIDLYLQPSVSNVPYLSKELLLDEKRFEQVYDVCLATLSEEAEFIAVACHSIYKEQLFTLNDFITLAILANKADANKIIKLAEETNVLDGLKIVLGVCSGIIKELPIDLKLLKFAEMLDATKLEVKMMPYKFPIMTVGKILLKRISKDSASKSHLPKIVAANASLTQLKKFFDHIVRDTY